MLLPRMAERQQPYRARASRAQAAGELVGANIMLAGEVADTLPRRLSYQGMPRQGG